jgi:hypothetical protein
VTGKLFTKTHAFMLLPSARDAAHVIHAFDQTELHGKTINVMVAHRSPRRGQTGIVNMFPESHSFKKYADAEEAIEESDTMVVWTGDFPDLPPPVIDGGEVGSSGGDGGRDGATAITSEAGKTGVAVPALAFVGGSSGGGSIGDNSGCSGGAAAVRRVLRPPPLSFLGPQRSVASKEEKELITDSPKRKLKLARTLEGNAARAAVPPTLALGEEAALHTAAAAACAVGDGGSAAVPSEANFDTLAQLFLVLPALAAHGCGGESCEQTAKPKPKGGAKWYVIADVDQMSSALKHSPVQDRVLYEMISAGCPVKPYLDVDMYVPFDGTEASLIKAKATTTSLILPLKETVKSVFAAHGVHVHDTSVLVDIKPPRVKPKKPDKIAVSCHVTVCQKGVFFANNADQQNFWWNMCDRTDSGEIVWRLNKNGHSTGRPMVYLPSGHEIDSFVYTKNRPWSMLYCGKVEGQDLKVFHPPDTDPAVFVDEEWRRRLTCHGPELKGRSLVPKPAPFAKDGVLRAGVIHSVLAAAATAELAAGSINDDGEACGVYTHHHPPAREPTLREEELEAELESERAKVASMEAALKSGNQVLKPSESKKRDDACVIA